MATPMICRALFTVTRTTPRIVCLQSALDKTTRTISTTSYWDRQTHISQASKSTSTHLIAQPRKSITSCLKSCFAGSRHASTSTPAAASTPASTTQLTWNEFLQLRRTRRYINLGASIGTAIGTIAVTVPIMAQYELENTIAAATGLDPFIAIGLTMTAIGGMGWLLGPVLGGAAFAVWKGGVRGEIARVRHNISLSLTRENQT